MQNNIVLLDMEEVHLVNLNSSGVIAAFSTRSLNLGFHNCSLIKDNRKHFLDYLKINYRWIVCLQQAHKGNVKEVTIDDRGKGALDYNDAIADVDALITKEKGLPLAVFTADCLSIFLYDKMTPSIGLVHAGWKGTYSNITRNTIEMMQRRFNTQPGDLTVAFGPAIRSCCYEVKSDLRRYFPQDIILRNDKLYLDLISLNKKLLISLGIKDNQILDSGICTSCQNKEFFSYRKEGKKAGRMMSVIMLR